MILYTETGHEIDNAHMGENVAHWPKQKLTGVYLTAEDIKVLAHDVSNHPQMTASWLRNVLLPKMT